MRRAGAALADRPQPGSIPRDYRRTGLPGDMIELFAERAAEYEARVRRITPDELPAAIAEALRQRDARRIAVPPGLPGNWLSDTGAEIERHGDDPPLTVAQLEQLDGVITGCVLAVAETGTIILDAGVGQGRRVLTLLPDYHLCIVRGDQIVATWPKAWPALDPTQPRPGSAARQPPATSNSTGSKVSTAPAPRTSSPLESPGVTIP
jgi:L-lactate dehydrogenase complex protein LldG